VSTPYRKGAVTAAEPSYLTSPHLLLSRAVVHHAVLGGHGGRVVQAGRVERHLLDVGDAVGDVGHAHPHRLLSVAPVLEELLEERRLAHLRQDLDLRVFGVTHLLDELVRRFHRLLSLVHVGVLAWKGREDRGGVRRIRIKEEYKVSSLFFLVKGIFPDPM